MVAADDFLGGAYFDLLFEGVAKLEYRGLTCIDVKRHYVKKQEVVKSCS